jgi:5-deoxy-glucuronate isomerase
VHPAHLPNELSAEELRLRSDGTGEVAVEPLRAGWRYLSFRALPVANGQAIALDPTLEHAIVLVAGGDVELERDTGASTRITGRSSPFEQLPTALYVPAGQRCVLRGAARGGGATTWVAVASAPSSGRDGVAHEAVTIGPRDIDVEVRGSGNATRQINHIIMPGFPADRLEIVEVVTPSGNWSSWPPHKHDVDNMPLEAVLEEVYYYRFRRPEAWGLQRLYRADRSRDASWEVRDGDLVLVTDGYHPFVATHGDDAYYLNALAGDRRTMACSYDPDFEWVLDRWPSESRDPRVPLVPK